MTEVSQRLLAVVKDHPDNLAWPPTFKLEHAKKLNAYATVEVNPRADGSGIARLDGNGRYLPYVAVDDLLVDDVIQSDPDRLAMVIGHELSHILLGHVLPGSLTNGAKTESALAIFSSEQEHDADISGIKLALAAGYSYRGTLSALEVWTTSDFKAKYPKLNYTSFEAVGIDHPSWADRLIYIDKDKASVWKATSAFENGIFFLTVQQYPSAEQAFARVVEEFPASYDAWANLGYARLMMYLDGFDAGDLKRYDIGQIIVGSFYQRPEEFRIRGVNARIWQKAVDSLDKALELRPDLSLAKANLGIAYLLKPEGKDANTAGRDLEQAVALLKSDKNLDDFNRGAVLINAAVAELSKGQFDLAQEHLKQARKLGGKNSALFGAADYNSALLALSADSRKQSEGTAGANTEKMAASLLADFLEKTTPASVWWGLGYELYAQLTKKQSIKPKSKEELSAGSRVQLRPIPSVEVQPGQLVTLSDRTDDVKSRIKPLTVAPVVQRTIEMLHHQPSGSDILAGRGVVAIFLHGPTAPTLRVQGFGTGAEMKVLSIGMMQGEVERILGPNSGFVPFVDPVVKYHFYPEVGVGVRYNNQHRVIELLIAQVVVKQ
jgi:tetratricopeptide (TPR) repeat protein